MLDLSGVHLFHQAALLRAASDIGLIGHDEQQETELSRHGGYLT